MAAAGLTDRERRGAVRRQASPRNLAVSACEARDERVRPRSWNRWTAPCVVLATRREAERSHHHLTSSASCTFLPLELGFAVWRRFFLARRCESSTSSSMPSGRAAAKRECASAMWCCAAMRRQPPSGSKRSAVRRWFSTAPSRSSCRRRLFEPAKPPRPRPRKAGLATERAQCASSSDRCSRTLEPPIGSCLGARAGPAARSSFRHHPNASPESDPHDQLVFH